MKKLLFLLFFLPSFAYAITPVFTCGFECGVFCATHMSRGGLADFATSPVRSGDRSGHVVVTANQQSLRVPLAANNIWVSRMYIRWAGLPTSDAQVVVNDATGTTQNYPGLYFKQSDSKVYCGSNTGAGVVSFGATGVSVTTGTWYRIDLYINTSANPWTVDAKIDGTDLGQYTTAEAATTPVTLQMGTNVNEALDEYFDDVIVSNTSGDYPIGGGYVNHFTVVSDGSHNIAGSNDFERSATGTDILNSTTDAYTLIDDVPLKTGTATEYINLVAPANATDYAEVVFGPAPGISTPTVAPRSVSVIASVAEGGLGTNNIRVAINDNGTTNDVFNGDPSNAGSTIVNYGKSYSDPPSAASVWTLSGNGNFNNLRARFYSSDATPDVWVASIMAEAEFEEVNNTVPGTPSDKRHTLLGVGMIARKNFPTINLTK